MCHECATYTFTHLASILVLPFECIVEVLGINLVQSSETRRSCGIKRHTCLSLRSTHSRFMRWQQHPPGCGQRSHRIVCCNRGGCFALLIFVGSLPTLKPELHNVFCKDWQMTASDTCACAGEAVQRPSRSLSMDSVHIRDQLGMPHSEN